ncbi:MAG: sodium:solute symporter family protein [Clostridia bacterium]|nr:sodium:solute symporter family protein [Clostridia bacterium]
MTVQIIVIVVYLAIVGYLGFLGFKHTKNSSDYLIGGRKIHPMVMALSYGATFISTSAIVGFGGVAAQFGMSLLWLTFLNIFFGIFIAFVFFGKRTRRMGHNINAHTFSEFVGKRYKSKFIQKFSALVIFVFMPLYTAAVMIGASKFIETQLNINYDVSLFAFSLIIAIYVFFGGLKGVMYSDAFQGTLMFVGMLILLVSVYSGLGGLTAAHEKLGALFANPDAAGMAMAPPGFVGWLNMPASGSIAAWVVISSVVMGVGIGVLAQPQLVVRFMTVKSDRELNRAVPIGGLFILMMTGVAFIVGPLSNVYFFEKFGMTAMAYAKSIGSGSEAIIPAFLNNFMPSWFSTVFLVVIIAAGMSTISSQFHAIGTAVGRDLFYSRKKGEKQNMLLSRVGMLVAIIVTILLAYVLPSIWNDSIAIATGLFFGICAASFLPLYVGALYFRNISKKAAIWGMMSGFTSSMLWMMFVHSKESAVLKICDLIFGKTTIAPAGTIVSYIDPIVISLSLSIVVTVVASLITKSKFEKEHIDECFEGVGK